MRWIIAILIIITGGQLLSAQNEALNKEELNSLLPERELALDSISIKHFGVNVGMSAFADFEGMYGFNTYVAPQWSLMPFKRFQVDVMPYFSRTNYYNIPVWGQMDATKLTLDESMLQFGVYTQGTYIINEKWYAGTAVFLDTNIPESSNSALQGVNNYGASTYVGYKFSDSFSAQVSFGVSKYPTYFSPTPGFMPMMHPRNPYNRF